MERKLMGFVTIETGNHGNDYSKGLGDYLSCYITYNLGRYWTSGKNSCQRICHFVSLRAANLRCQDQFLN